jgi:V/A-type H+-transporting ATPase subunit D
MSVSPTRLELNRLKHKLELAVRGYKLLKDKRGEMMRRFIPLIRENYTLRAGVERKLSEVFGEFSLCRGAMDPAMLDAALLLPARSVEVDAEIANIMSVKAPRFSAAMGDEALSYGLVQTSALLDSSISLLASALPDLIKLAEIEKTCDLLADEIARTSRRINALEHRLIPDLKDTIRFITKKLHEVELGERVRLMKIKEFIT